MTIPSHKKARNRRAFQANRFHRCPTLSCRTITTMFLPHPWNLPHYRTFNRQLLLSSFQILSSFQTAWYLCKITLGTPQLKPKHRDSAISVPDTLFIFSKYSQSNIIQTTF